jgi:hypothetical protein
MSSVRRTQMEITLTIPPNGQSIAVETISILEDLWHDYQFFRGQASMLDCPGFKPGDRLVAKRFRRAALLMLHSYREGVANRWLRGLRQDSERSTIERKRLIAAVKARTAAADRLKNIRDDIVHLTPGNDLKLYDEITDELLGEAEASITAWLDEVEVLIGVERHPNTREESRALRQALGEEIPESEGYSGQ